MNDNWDLERLWREEEEVISSGSFDWYILLNQMDNDKMTGSRLNKNYWSIKDMLISSLLPKKLTLKELKKQWVQGSLDWRRKIRWRKIRWIRKMLEIKPIDGEKNEIKFNSYLKYINRSNHHFDIQWNSNLFLITGMPSIISIYCFVCCNMLQGEKML